MPAATVTDCLERARECAARADTLSGDEKIQMLAVAEAWLKVADEAAKEAAKLDGKLKS
jgi:hypothetical protein